MKYWSHNNVDDSAEKSCPGRTGSCRSETVELYCNDVRNEGKGSGGLEGGVVGGAGIVRQMGSFLISE